MKQILLFRGKDGALFGRDYSTGKDTQVLFHQDTFILPYGKEQLQIDNRTGEQIYYVYQDNAETVFKLTLQSQQTFIRTGAGGKSGISGINIQDEGIQFGGQFITLNFEGASVTVTDDGGGKATITVGGNGMITGGGTVNRLAMFTGATTIGDSPFLRSGSDVIAD